MKHLTVALLMLSMNALAEEIHYPPIEYDIPESKWGKAVVYTTTKCNNPMNLFELCKSKRLIAAETKIKLFFDTHKKCKNVYIKSTQTCGPTPKVKK